MDLSTNMTQIILAVIAGIFAVGIAIRFIVKKTSNRNNNSNNVVIKNNKTEGDIAGRDINKK